MNLGLPLLVTSAWTVMVLPIALADRFAHPTHGRSSAIQARDETECRTWAVHKSGFDPRRAAPPPVVVAAAGALSGGDVGATAAARNADAQAIDAGHAAF